MFKENQALMKGYLDSVNRLFKVLVSAVTLLELLLLIRGLLYFNLDRLKLRLYLYSYGFLFVTSLASLVLFWIYGHREEHFTKTQITIYVYAFCFIMWSAGVACIDCYASGDSGIIVYVITCISVGVLTLLKPWVFLCYLAVSSAFLLTVTAAVRGWEPYSTGFYLNFAVFLVMAISINSHNYRLSLREYQSRKTLELHADTDPLTGLYNRRKLDRHIQEVSGQHSFVLVILDVDEFKQVNDRFGHTTGDTCLEQLARLLTNHFGDQVYRMGGDEFAVVSPFDTAQTCSHIDAVNRELKGVMERFPLCISAGIYQFQEGDTQTEAFKKADIALYRVKNAGGAGWDIYS